MEVEGSFDNWSTRQILQRTGKDFTIIRLLPPGVYQVPGEREGEGLGREGERTCAWGSEHLGLEPLGGCGRASTAVRVRCL